MHTLVALSLVLADTYWDPSVVTPTGQPALVSESPSTTFVITGDEVRRSGAESLAEVLRRVPGVDVRLLTASDGQVGPRGFAFELAERVLVLVDGRRATIDFFGGSVFDLLPLSPVDIDRIEVVVGPGAAVYGDGAFLGTINIITRSAADYPRLDARTSLGPNGDARGGLRYGVRTGSYRARATAQLRRLSFFEDAPARSAQQTVSGTFAFGYSPSSEVESNIEGGITHGLTSVVTPGSRFFPFEASVGYVKMDSRVVLPGESELLALLVWNSGRLSSPYFPAGRGTFTAEYQTPYAEVSHRLRYELFDLPMQLRWGAEARWNTLRSSITTRVPTQLAVAGFASNEAEIGDLRLTTGLRVDRQSVVTAIASPRLSLVYAIAPGHQLRLALNQAYKNPAPVFQYADFVTSDTTYVVGNPALVPERISYAELGYGGVTKFGLKLALTGFAYRMRHFIALEPAPPLGGKVAFANNVPLDAWGFESSAETNLSKQVSVYGSYALLRLSAHEGFPYHGKNLGSPRHKVGAGLRYDTSTSIYATLDAQWVSAAHVDRVPTDGGGAGPFLVTRVPAYAMVNARVGYVFDGGVELSLAASNLLDDRTRQLPGAEKPRRTVLATVEYHP